MPLLQTHVRFLAKPTHNFSRQIRYSAPHKRLACIPVRSMASDIKTDNTGSIMQTVGLLSRISVAWAATLATTATLFAKNPLNFRKQIDRRDLPAELPLPDMTTEFIEVNGVKLFTVRHGKGSGKPLMLFVHGFPESWRTWKYQLKEFAGEYEVAAFNLRGYGPSSAPEGLEQYKLDVLVEDLRQMVKALGHKSCILVAHDWGAAISWALVQKYPELVERYVAVTLPPPWKFAQVLDASKEQQAKSWYIGAFLMPKVPELNLSANDFEMIESLYTVPLLGGVKNPDKTPSPADLEQMKKPFSYPYSLTAALNYYRANLGNPNKLGRGPKIQVPVLMLWADNDIALTAGLYTNTEEWGTDVRVQEVKDCSHWIPFDRPEEMNAQIREFLTAGVKQAV